MRQKTIATTVALSSALLAGSMAAAAPAVAAAPASSAAAVSVSSVELRVSPRPAAVGHTMRVVVRTNPREAGRTVDLRLHMDGKVVTVEKARTNRDGKAELRIPGKYVTKKGYRFTVTTKGAAAVSFRSNADSRLGGVMAPPPAPKGISIEPGDGALYVSWRPVVGATEYRGVLTQGTNTIYGPWEADTEHAFTGLTNGALYTAGAQARNAAGEISPVSTDSNASPTVDAPGPVSGLVAQAASGKVTLSWDGAARADEYVVRYRVAGTPFTYMPHGTTLGATQPYTTTIKSLTDGVKYDFEVYGLNSFGRGAGSNADATPQVMDKIELSYPDTTFTTGSNLQQLAPEVSANFDPFTPTYTLSGTLPDGVTFDSETGVFTGPAADQWVRAGQMDTSFADPQIKGYVAATQQDGKVVVAGGFPTVGDVTQQKVARFNPDGTLDTSFVDPQVDGYVNAIAILPNGKMLISGDFQSVGGQQRENAARLNADGTLDTSFGNPKIDGYVASIAGAADGKVLIAGSFGSVAGSTHNGVARLNADGSLDETFADANPGGSINSVAPYVDGKVLVAGGFTMIDGEDRNSLAVLNADGSVDLTFANPGIDGMVNQVGAQPDGKILVAGGFVGVKDEGHNGIARFNADGSLDMTFADSGVDGYVSSFALTADGKVVVGGGFGSVWGVSQQAVTRLNSDGTRDLTFTNPQVEGFVAAVAVTTGGDIYAGGGFKTVAGKEMEGLVRLHGSDEPFPGLPATVTVTATAKGVSTSTTVTLRQAVVVTPR